MSQFSSVSNTAIVEDTNAPAVAWSAIIAGSAVIITTSWVLSLLGLGLGFAVAPATPATHTPIESAIWMIVVQWLSAALGGFLAGRLRVKWPGLHTHEVFFRDTAHGFLAWTLSTLATLIAFSSGPVSIMHQPQKETAVIAVLSMLIGAFVASVAAAIGGAKRDEY